MLQNNLLAIDTFLAGESIQAKLGAFILANYWKPAKFHTESFNYWFLLPIATYYFDLVYDANYND